MSDRYNGPRGTAHYAAGVVWGSKWPEQMDAILEAGLRRYCAEAKRRMG